MNGYLFNILVSVDQFTNTLFGGNPDDTISLRAAKAKAKGEQWGCVLCKVLDWFDKDHCDKVET
jgi:hypothetical protein